MKKKLYLVGSKHLESRSDFYKWVYSEKELKEGLRTGYFEEGNVIYRLSPLKRKIK